MIDLVLYIYTQYSNLSTDEMNSAIEEVKNNSRYRFRFVDCKTCCLLLSRQNSFNFKGRCGN